MFLSFKYAFIAQGIYVKFKNKIKLKKKKKNKTKIQSNKATSAEGYRRCRL